MKRFALFTILLLASVLAGPLLAATGATATPDHLTLTWSADPATTMTITWRADTTIDAGLVRYEKGGELTGGAHTAKASATNFTTDLGPCRLFTVKLTGLAPNTAYTYRAGSDKGWSATHTFTTANPEADSFKFLVFSDSQSVNYTLWKKTLHNAFKANPDAKFFAVVGDLVDIGQSAAQWNAWFKAAAGVIDTIPVVPVVGNHELYGKPKTKKPTYFVSQFRLPQNGPAGLKGQVYSFNYGLAHFTVLDSESPLDGQKTWLDKDLAGKATWKFAFFHRAPYDIKTGDESTHIKKAFCPTLERHHADLVFSGHDHGVARTFPMNNGAIMDKPSQGTIYYIAGRADMKTYRDLQKTPATAFFYNPLDQPTYVVVEVAAQKTTVTAKKLDGTVIDSFTIDKEADIITDN